MTEQKKSERSDLSLHRLVSEGRFDEAVHEIKQGADVTVKNEVGYTVLAVLVDELLSPFADKEKDIKAAFPLIEALVGSNATILDELGDYDLTIKELLKIKIDSLVESSKSAASVKRLENARTLLSLLESLAPTDKTVKDKTGSLAIVTTEKDSPIGLIESEENPSPTLG